VAVKITTSENELIELLPEGSGNFYADGAYISGTTPEKERGFRVHSRFGSLPGDIAE